MTARDAAARITEVVNSNMARALRIVSVERGHDPREFSLIAFGGAGPVHAVALVQELPIPEVIIPPAPGAFSALGLVATDLKRDYAQTLYADLGSVDPSWVAATYAGMERAGAAMLEAAVAPAERQSLPRFADVRYPRQADELTLPVADGPVTRESLDRLAAAFHDKHEQTYGHANRGEAVQLVTLRLTALGKARGSEAVPAIRPRYRAGPDARHLVRRDWLRSGSGALEKRPDCRDNRDRAGRHLGLRLDNRHPARLDELGYLRMTRA
jgi:N-methylhydantoinase A